MHTDLIYDVLDLSRTAQVPKPDVVAVTHDGIRFGIAKATHSQVPCLMESSTFTVLGKDLVTQMIYRY